MSVASFYAYYCFPQERLFLKEMALSWDLIKQGLQTNDNLKHKLTNHGWAQTGLLACFCTDCGHYPSKLALRAVKTQGHLGSMEDPSPCLLHTQQLQSHLLTAQGLCPSPPTLCGLCFGNWCAPSGQISVWWMTSPLSICPSWGGAQDQDFTRLMVMVTMAATSPTACCVLPP